MKLNRLAAVVLAAGMMASFPVYAEETVQTISVEEEEGYIDGMPNPWSEFVTLEEAAAMAGFTLTLPASLSADQLVYRVLPGEPTILEIIGLDADGDEIWSVRKGTGTDDISGDSYEHDISVYSQSKDMTLKGEYFSFTHAVWTRDGYSYSFASENGYSSEELEQLVDEIDREEAENDTEEDFMIDGMPDPWQNFATLEEAENESGLTIVIGIEPDGTDHMEYRVLPGENPLLEVIFFDAEGNEICRLRKSGEIGADISGDNTSYDKTWNFSMMEITIRGEGQKGFVAEKNVWDGTVVVLCEDQPMDIETLYDFIDIIDQPILY